MRGYIWKHKTWKIEEDKPGGEKLGAIWKTDCVDLQPFLNEGDDHIRKIRIEADIPEINDNNDTPLENISF